MKIPKLAFLPLTLTTLFVRLSAIEDVSMDLSFDAGSAFVRWSNQSQREISYYRNQSTSNGDQYWGYRLYLINEEDEVTKVFFVGETEASVPDFSNLKPGETETTEIDLDAWFKKNEEYEMPRPKDGRYITFMKYDDSEYDGSLGFTSLGTHFSSIATLQIENGKVKN
ncbi:hypothetical protein [Pelagicoccus albus]|uniref:Uncharacterized protein n=1 Tax=Pelagicoccus albus TaxID=415222 RepID=A0A7X1B691_9BACT|nr:hypothetical protein [Pelagicoccus albus]MBC2606293.1 hypothetical protein [Pelagicoccus albus]MBC2606302.1 hypothetical protein [Pelagicoccus albus]MBC2606331.1 hypothetical protein [Pelagicoccus albus]